MERAIYRIKFEVNSVSCVSSVSVRTLGCFGSTLLTLGAVRLGFPLLLLGCTMIASSSVNSGKRFGDWWCAIGIGMCAPRTSLYNGLTSILFSDVVELWVCRIMQRKNKVLDLSVLDD